MNSRMTHIEKLLDVLLEYEYNNTTKLELANYCMNKSIRFFKQQHKSQNKNTPALVNAINEHLDRVKDICSDITYREKLKKIEIEVTKDTEKYLFSWKEVKKERRID